MEHIRAEFVEGMKKDMYDYIMDKEKYQSEQLVHPQLFEVGTATGAYEQHTTVIGAGNLKVKAEGEKITYSKVGEGFTVMSTWDTYADGLEFTKENVADFTESKISNLVSDMASTWMDGYMQGKDTLAANVFNYGGYTAGNAIFNGSAAGVTDPTGNLCYDGKPFFNLSGNLRPLTPNGTATHYNALALPLTETNLQTAYDLMTITNAVNSRGQKVIIKPDVLWFHPSLRWTVKKLLESDKEVATANNTINTAYKILRPVEWRFLDTSTMWGLGYSKRGIKFWEREPLTFDFYQDKETKGWKADVTARYGIEVNDFRYWVGSNIPTS